MSEICTVRVRHAGLDVLRDTRLTGIQERKDWLEYTSRKSHMHNKLSPKGPTNSIVQFLWGPIYTYIYIYLFIFIFIFRAYCNVTWTLRVVHSHGAYLGGNHEIIEASFFSELFGR